MPISNPSGVERGWSRSVRGWLRGRVVGRGNYGDRACETERRFELLAGRREEIFPTVTVRRTAERMPRLQPLQPRRDVASHLPEPDQRGGALSRPTRGSAGCPGSTRKFGRPLGIFDDGAREVDAELVVEGREDLLELDRSLDRLLAERSVAPITCPVFMPPPARRQKFAFGQWSRLLFLLSLRGAAELAPHHDRDVAGQARARAGR